MAQTGMHETEDERAFERMIRDLREAEAQDRRRLLDANAGEALGVEARNDRGQPRWAALLPEMSDPNYPVRLQYYDTEGLSGHSCFASVDAALTEMVRNHYTDPDCGALQRLQNDPAWWAAMRRAEAFRAENERHIHRIQSEPDLDAVMQGRSAQNVPALTGAPGP